MLGNEFFSSCTSKAHEAFMTPSNNDMRSSGYMETYIHREYLVMMYRNNKKKGIQRFPFTKNQYYGIESYKFHLDTKRMNSFVQSLEQHVKQMLTSSPSRKDSIKNHKKARLNVCLEAPKFLLNWVRPNHERFCPIRNYFGRLLDENENAIKMTSYGTGSGSSTVGGDSITNRTRRMSPKMVELCDELSTYVNSTSKLFSKGNKVTKKIAKDVCFNHVTVLFYLTDSTNDDGEGRKYKKSTLNPHCDVTYSASNKYNPKHNTQREDTPTIVLSLFEPKKVSFFKDYTSDGKTWDVKVPDKLEEVEAMTTGHGEFFFLHPADERPLKRRVLTVEKKFENETKASRFKHGVICQSYAADDVKYKVSVSICVRQVTKELWHNKNTLTVSNELGELEQNDARSDKMVKRSNHLKRERNTLQKSFQKLEKRLKNYNNRTFRQCRINGMEARSK